WIPSHSPWECAVPWPLACSSACIPPWLPHGCNLSKRCAMIRPVRLFMFLWYIALSQAAWAVSTVTLQTTAQSANNALNAPMIDLTLSDAVLLGLRDNRSIRSAYLERI